MKYLRDEELVNYVTKQVNKELALRHSMRLKNGVVNDVYVGFGVYETIANEFYLHPRPELYVPRVLVGMYGQRPTTFLPKKDGSFNYSKIADRLAERYYKLAKIHSKLKN